MSQYLAGGLSLGAGPAYGFDVLLTSLSYSNPMVSNYVKNNPYYQRARQLHDEIQLIDQERSDVVDLDPRDGYVKTADGLVGYYGGQDDGFYVSTARLDDKGQPVELVSKEFLNCHTPRLRESRLEKQGRAWIETENSDIGIEIPNLSITNRPKEEANSKMRVFQRLGLIAEA